MGHGSIWPVLGGVALSALLAFAPHESTTPAPGPEPAGERWVSGLEQRESVALTVYNQGFGLVREVRNLDIPAGEVALEFGGVASSIQPETVHLRALSDGPLSVLEQNYQFDLLSPQKLLEKYVGRTVTIYRWSSETQREEPVQAEVLSVHQGTVLRIGDEITFDYPGRFAFPEVPENLIARPTLLWRLANERERPRVEVSYLANGLSWKSDYVMVLEEDDRSAGLTGWVTLTNQSGASFQGATLKLVAGDVQRLEKDGMRDEMRTLARAAAAEQEASFTEEGFFEYHLYTLGRPATVLDNEQKQVTLLEAPELPVEKKLIYHGASHYYRSQWGEPFQNQKVGVYLDFRNGEGEGLGMPLPRGTVRVYKRDASGAQQFVGEDLIDHTPRDERVRIKMGEAFDVVGDRRQMEFDIVSSCVVESDWQVDLRNHKDEAVTVEVMEPIGGDWTMLSSSHAPRTIDARTFAFDVPVAGRGEARLTYRVRVRWC